MTRKTIKELNCKLHLVHREGAFPLVGWHNPWADLTHEGETFKLAIGGGCSTICISRPGEMGYFEIEIAEILPCMLEALPKKRS